MIQLYHICSFFLLLFSPFIHGLHFYFFIFFNKKRVSDVGLVTPRYVTRVDSTTYITQTLLELLLDPLLFKCRTRTPTIKSWFLFHSFVCSQMLCSYSIIYTMISARKIKRSLKSSIKSVYITIFSLKKQKKRKKIHIHVRNVKLRSSFAKQ